MTFPDEIFRSYDIRGTVDQLSEELAESIGAAMVQLTGAKTVVVGRDMRETSPAFSQAVIKGITGAGANVVDIGMCSTPMFKFALSNYPEHEAGVMVTASHNPPEFNGFKMMRGNGMAISGVEMKEALQADLPRGSSGKVSEMDISEPYLEKLFSLVELPDLSHLKVVVDAGNGMGGVILPKLFERLDCHMIPLFFEPDGNFPNHEANPIKEETLEDLIARVQDTKASLGIGLDGDADRIGFVDERGEFIRGDQLFALLISDRLKDHPGKGIVWSPNASWSIRDAIQEGKGVSLLEKVGWKHIVNRMQKEEAVLGGEVSAHYFYPEFGFAESTDFTILLVLKLLAESGKSMSALIAPYQKYPSPGEVNFEVSDKDAAIAALREKYEPEAKDVNDLDGIRLEFADWWFNIRKSNTEPLIRLNMEATSKEILDEKFAEISAFIKALG